MNGRERLLAACRGEPTDRLPHIPISMMIAADGVGVKYGKYILDAEAHIRGQLAFAQTYDVDHVSSISCPTTEAADLGASILYYDDQPPAIDEENALLADKGKLSTLKPADAGTERRMSKRLAVISGLKQAVRGERAVEGWVEGPIAEACDLRGINRVMTDFYDDPAFVRELFEFVHRNAMGFAREQMRAGADVIGIGDAAASLVGPQIYRDFILPWEHKYVRDLHAMGAVVRLHICGDVRPLLSMIGELGADIVDLDSLVGLGPAREAMGPRQLLAGNIDPVRVLKNGTAGEVRAHLADCRAGAAGGPYAVAAGCEIPRQSPPANLRAMRDFASIG